MRSFAIVPVVLYHAGVTLLSGGFVGVDIFFVISGFLITSIITRELDQNRFSITDFYRRRILRIVPLLLVVVLAVLVVGHFVLFPFELKALGETAAATALFVSNIYFYLTTDYFDAPANGMPLLHTWSLAVEEQFYIFFPVLLWALHRWARPYLLPVLVALVIGSFALSIAGTQIARIFTFYMLPTRAWELGAGAVLAVAPLAPVRSRFWREALGWAGLVLVLAPLFYLTEASAFPGLNALPPVLGATILIGWAQGTAVGRMLEWRPLVYLGLISYALYLWHWPVIVFDAFVTGPDMAPLDVLRVIGLSLVLAMLSRPLIETPFRRGFKQVPSGGVLAAGAAVLLAIAGAGWVLMQTDLLERRYPPDILALADFAQYPETAEYRAHFAAGRCFIDDRDPPDAVVDRESCLRLDPARPNILLLGDSHAAHLSGGLRAAYPQYNFLQATSAGCRPLPGIWQEARCAALMDFVLNRFLPQNTVDGIIIAGRWTAADIPRIVALADEARTHVPAVMVVGPSVEYGGAVPTMLARARVWGDRGGALAGAMLSEPIEIDHQLAAALAGHDVAYRSAIAIVCPGGQCRETAPDGAPMQFDYGHLTLSGSRVVATGLLDGWLRQ